MAAKTAETEASGLRNVRAIAAFAAFILLGLGIWRASDVFTQPAVGTAAISLEQEKLLHVIEPLTGPGNVRVSVRRSEAGERDFLVMIDTASSGARDLGQQIEAILGKAAGFTAAQGDTLTVQEFPFADGARARPEASELAQLGIMGLLVFLLSWGAFAPASSAPAPEITHRKKPRRGGPAAPEDARRPRPVAVDMTPSDGSSAAAAAKTASDNPAETAKIIRAWMRAPESQS